MYLYYTWFYINQQNDSILDRLKNITKWLSRQQIDVVKSNTVIIKITEEEWKKSKWKTPSISVSRGHYYKISTTVCLVNLSGKKIKHCRVCPSLILHLIPYHHILPRYHPYSDYATIPIFFARKHNEAAYFSIVHYYYYYSYIHHYCSISRYYLPSLLPKNSTIILNPLFLLSTISVVKINNYCYLSIYYTYPLFLPY